MAKGNHQGRVLRDHKKIGQKLIPPFMQLPNLKETSFRDNTLPCLIWVSALFLRATDREAVHNIIEFLIKCREILDDDKSPPLVFLNNFDKLNDKQKLKILNNLNDDTRLNFLRENLVHQYHLFDKYPLSFIFQDYTYGVDKEEAIDLLKEDVSALLDRYTLHSTKVQTTAFISMTATGKLFLSSKIDLPDFNSIFTAPDSDESKRVASFVRANINAGAGFQDTEGGENEWSKSFWSQSFGLEACS
ncbi:hypothetical protein [Pseudoalteromonas ruthenica]|uniref:Uncharacterized protein n=1 Tax=Pseudoalteromonas ruthenica TaxID=151081 RepID=A0A0F4PXX6_9GAMM|nr:hypothetical protein [Pseudoalteromonas ruthenica]KJY95782.1 hypothetical protein TW76_14525 [Pseudoalteromonas ruthenica]KJZ00331.1 hypothetical protein TW72_06425 [Pseudoalteromonas ruthenica]TMO90141.1 hypothetical protein CWC12_01370 [Pseudoalteromonas ruthenica]TMO90796.1 hypothetical protein CWC13_18185 [Pseudoalteromonas ruthenica]TMP01033.1 hypothetical protein CWC07_01555 [Pseudoalteromonas ruthenica]